MSTVIEETSEGTEQQATKWVYLFEEGPGDDKSLLGGKGAGLCEMTRAGLPVPPGLIVTTQACNAFFDNDKAFPDGMWEQVKDKLPRPSTSSKQKSARVSAMRRILCWCRFDRARRFRCRE